mgnify:CR=1 FL=1
MEEGAMCMDLYNVQKLLQAKVLTGSELSPAAAVT